MKTAPKKRTFTKASPKKTEFAENAVPVAQPVARPIIAEPPKQKIIVEEKDAVPVQTEPSPTQKVKEVPQDKIEEAPVVVAVAATPVVVEPTVQGKEPKEKIEAVSTSKSDIPNIDKNAALKIDEAKREEESVPLEKFNRKLFYLGGIVLVLITTGVLGFIFLYIKNPPEEKNAVTLVAQKTIQASPSAVLPVLVRSEWTFEVLNGSGTAGVAKKAADKLTALGYKVISTGNANTSNYIRNELYVSQEMESKVNLVIADLKNTITIATVAGILKDSTASARLIIGKE